jgi:hypothetical protein
MFSARDRVFRRHRAVVLSGGITTLLGISGLLALKWTSRGDSMSFAPRQICRQPYRAARRARAGAVLLATFGLIGLFGSAANSQTSRKWLPATAHQAGSIQVLIDGLTGQVPPTIPKSLTYPDLTGKISSYQPAGALTTSTNAFFASGLGGSTNGRTCFTCHQPQDGWGLKPSTALANYLTTGGKSVLFQPVDGADCPSLITPHQTVSQFLSTHKQMLTKANTRIFIAENPAPDWFTVSVVNDPTTCENSALYGLNANPPVASFYRRPLPTANVNFLDPLGPNPFVPSVNGTAFSVMWDSREPTVETQFNDAVLIHAQAPNPPTTAEITEGFNF